MKVILGYQVIKEQFLPVMIDERDIQNAIHEYQERKKFSEQIPNNTFIIGDGRKDKKGKSLLLVGGSHLKND